MRLLLANPNTTQAVTDSLAAAARAVALPDTQIVPVTARFGGRVIGTRTEMAVAEHAALDLLAREAGGCDAVVIGASIDSGLRAAREMLAVPVLGLTESALHVACLSGGTFGVVTLSRRSAYPLREMIAGYGLAGRCGGLRAVDADPLELLQAPQRVAALIVAAAADLVAREMVDCIVLIGAVMAAMPARVQPHLPVPVIEGVSSAVTLAESLVRLRLPKARAGGYAALPARELVGVDPALAARFAGATTGVSLTRESQTMSATPVVAQKAPFQVTVEAGKSYWWCACGQSKAQPFCDGSHKGSGFTPLEYKAEKDGDAWFCGCKSSGGKPMCDGSHKRL
jgi:allantoin racemase